MRVCVCVQWKVRLNIDTGIRMICKEREREREEVIKEGERGSCMYNNMHIIKATAAYT